MSTSSSDSDEEYTPVSYKRKRIDSEEYTIVDDIKLFKSLHEKFPDLTVLQLKEKAYEIHPNSVWLHAQIKAFVSECKNPDTLRVARLISYLEQNVDLKHDDSSSSDESDESMDEEELEEDPRTMLNNLLFHIIQAEEANEDIEREATGSSDDDSNMTKFKKLINPDSKEDHTLKFFKGLPLEKQQYYIDALNTLRSRIESASDTPYLLRLIDFKIDDVTKQTIFDHVLSLNTLNKFSSEYNKKVNLINAIKRLPFNKVAPLPEELIQAMKPEDDVAVGQKRVRISRQERITSYLDSVEKSMDKNIYGHKEGKNQIMRLIASMITNGSVDGGHCIGLCGPPGIGKTQFAQEIAKALGRKSTKLNMGGASGGDELVGHGYTYEGSTYGSIARCFMDTGCENPVIIFEEIDKISLSDKGKEIEGILTCITDSTQNHLFQDKYMPGVNINLRKAVMIFTLNDTDKVCPILLDRMKIIRVGGYKIHDKVVIAKKYLLPSIKRDLGYELCNYKFDDLIIRDLINQYTFEGGVRRLKELLTDILMELNLRMMTGQKVAGIEPTHDMEITKSMIRDDIFKERHFVQHIMIPDKNQVGVVNGLWAGEFGVGGLIPIESHFIPTATKFDLLLTGMQGDVMKESMNVAKTVVWRFLSKSQKKRLMHEWEKIGPTGLHVHCPDGSTRKNGPSAGAGIATSMFSRLTNCYVDRTVAMTGELNLSGDVTAIGGLEEKMFGAITAGVKTILFPKENQRDCDKIRDKFPDLFDKDSSSYIEMIPVSRIEEIFDRVLLN